MHPIIALWSHPRSMSTATERIMRERGDLTCFHEPFIYDYYIHRKVRVIPFFKTEENRPVSFNEVRKMLLKQAESTPVFFKDMSYYVVPQLLDDVEFNRCLTNCFLIRNPIASIASYFKLDPAVTREEIGLEAQWRHYAALAEMPNKKRVIIQAEDIRNNPKKAVRGLWRAIGLTDADHAFEWGEETPRDWQQVEGWHRDVIKSKGIRPITTDELESQIRTFEQIAKKYPVMLDYLAHHQPYYEALKAQAINI